ncbi:MAG: hypothetical protein A2W90_00075 [Bacteroidetes bacterium GWF2_42_66]|nr:MAG: hypothetical protein A2W92_09255 [Bacteroidetes bacterium GWA2_42_15]OFX98003.1 MAG: hypothetical protein A2W89_07510 [Bacteroidetes bacterium GWE2_42_39]OFY44173.1 MAG: hypothetical protein A2W90_00075 [Bacteroidetes bacterium GWF2_42_66]
MGTAQQQKDVSGKITDSKGLPLPGVTVLVKGTMQGIISNADGNYSLANIPANATLVFSFVGMKSQEISVNGKASINVKLEEETIGIEEVVAVGYGTMRKSDLTGSVFKADIDKFRDQSNVSIIQSLHGSVAGLNVSQITTAGAEPSISIRGRTSISGEQDPLIVLDGVLFRGNMIDINPDDIGSIDILKDNSAAAVYGSQAANGVIIITSKSGKGKNNKPLINYTASYSLQTPTVELKPGNGEDFINKTTEIDWRESRTSESGYIDPKPDYSVLSLLETNELVENYLAGRETNWYDLLTNDNIFIQNHNLSLTNKTEYLNYFISVGYTDQQGYMLNEDYKRYNARINVDNQISKWLTIGIQSFFTMSDKSGKSPSPSDRYINPYEAAYKENGELNPLVRNLAVGPLVIANADNLDIRNNFFGNLYANIDVPFVKGLSYKINFSNNYRTTRSYYFQPYSNNFQGEAQKSYSNTHDMSSDNILTFKRRFNNKHNLDVTLLYGFEQRKYDYTDANSSVFVNDILGYNSLQSGSSELQKTYSGAWAEKSLYSMARLFYSYRDKYMITGTVRRDGFSGFSEKNKFGIFPSVATGWVVSEEPFFKDINKVMNYLKLRLSYGTIGNRTVSRYQTLAKVDGDFGYVDASGASVYAKSISSLASTDLKWETTTGFNLGVDFAFLNSRLSGSVEYYNNNTNNLLYNVDIPSIGRFKEFPDNLGRIHNQGIEITLSSINIERNDFRWNSNVTFSRNRDELKELLGFDNDGDGKEDDLISEGLFIGQPLSAVYHYEVTGELYQLDDNVTAGMVGSQIIVDQNGDENIDPSDKVILGYREPSYRFSITNQFKYKNWSLSVFINAVQGGKDYYLGSDNLHSSSFGNGTGFSDSSNGLGHYRLNFPTGLDYWLPENPNARYAAIGTNVTSGLLSSSWIQRNFVRLQDVSLNYNFKSSFLNKINVNNLRLFLSGQNLYTWTKWPGWDPETGEGISKDGRPVLRSYTLGLNFEF